MLLKSFLDYLLLEKKYSVLTVNAYQKDIEEYIAFYKDEYGSDKITESNYSQIRIIGGVIMRLLSFPSRSLI